MTGERSPTSLGIPLDVEGFLHFTAFEQNI